ncbi:hypothetical protein Taro_032614 [Colocasia esculenta]|uniref:Ubiquitin-like protease family profile domain-containing protein n=1 Tax=Colocasia esculenta TaxID=4460 RepID=A0A843W4F3_COLES|nr:hypothetical protein [Colocasia esculenta]
MDRHNVHLKLKEYVPQEGKLAFEISVKLWFALLCSCFYSPTSGTSGLLSILPYLDDLHEMKNANWAAAIHEYLISGVKAFGAVAGSSKTIFLTGCVPTLGRNEEQRKKKDQEEDQRKKKDEEEAEKKKKEEEEEESKRKRHQLSPSSLSRRVSAGTRIRRQPELYTPDDFWHHKATKVNVSTSEPIFVDSQESTDTLPRGKKEERRDYVAREALGVAEKSLIERFLNECIINEYIEFMFHGTVEGYDNFLSFHDIRGLLFARESESVVIDCYVNAYLFLPREENPNLFWNFGYVGAALKGFVESCRDDKSKEQHFEYAFGKLDRAPNEFDLIFSPMHVGTNHWALLVIHNKEKEFHVYDSLRNKHRPDIPQYVEELKSYLKGKHIDADKWPLRYPDPCPQQGSGDDYGIFTCKYMECLARRDIQDLPFSQDDMPYVRAKITVHFIKAYFNAQGRS